MKKISLKKYLMFICFFVALCACIRGYETPAEAAVYKCTYTKYYRAEWSDGTNKIYLNKTRDKLYCKDLQTGEEKLLTKLKVTDDIYYLIANVYGDKIYLNKAKDISYWDIYVYDMKANTLKKFKKDCYIQNAYGKYMVTSPYTPTDISPYPTDVYQISGNSLKKLVRLGKNTSCALFMNGKLYYASYPNVGKKNCSGLNVMKVYSCDKNGKNKKLVFTRKTADSQGYVLMQQVTSNKIIFAQTDPVDRDAVYYKYDLKTGKIAKSKEQ